MQKTPFTEQYAFVEKLPLLFPAVSGSNLLSRAKSRKFHCIFPAFLTQQQARKVYLRFKDMTSILLRHLAGRVITTH
jgi:hypothetical protein